MGIEGKCSSISFCIVWQSLPLIFGCNFTGHCFYPPFWRPKGCKSSASEYNASLLVDCKRAQPTLFKRHSTDKISHSLLGSQIFASENIPRSSLACRQLSPQKNYAGVCKFSRATARQKNFHTLFRAFSVPVACDFDNAVFFWKLPLHCLLLSKSNFLKPPAPLKCTVRARMFFG